MAEGVHLSWTKRPLRWWFEFMVYELQIKCYNTITTMHPSHEKCLCWTSRWRQNLQLKSYELQSGWRTHVLLVSKYPKCEYMYAYMYAPKLLTPQVSHPQTQISYWIHTSLPMQSKWRCQWFCHFSNECRTSIVLSMLSVSPTIDDFTWSPCSSCLRGLTHLPKGYQWRTHWTELGIKTYHLNTMAFRVKCGNLAQSNHFEVCGDKQHWVLW